VEVMSYPSNRGAEEALAQLRADIEQRVDDLENFYYENDLDERAILFEKQRLKLRKVLTTEVEPMLELEEEAAAPDSAVAQRRPTTADSAAMRRSQARKEAKSNGAPLVHSSKISGKKSRVAPIYDWEVRGSSKGGDADQEAGPAPRCFEFQVRLSPEEYEELMDRRAAAGARGRSFLHKGDGQTMSTARKKALESNEEGEFVTSSGPYIEPTYFENWRKVNKNKWVAKSDFNRNVIDHDRIDASAQQREFLQTGPHIESGFKTCLRSEDKSKWVSDEFRRHV